MSDLKPCPFCGGEAEQEVTMDGVHWVLTGISCPTCDYEIGSIRAGESPSDSWNTRQPLKLPRVKPEELVEGKGGLKVEQSNYQKNSKEPIRTCITAHTSKQAESPNAPGMAEIDALERELLDEIPSWSQRTSIELLADLARRSIAAREEVVGLLDHILSCIITVKQENTPEWMEYIAEEVNKINEAIGGPDRVVVNCCDIVIVRGKSEIVEGE